MSYKNNYNIAEEKIILARDDAKDHLYEPKPNKKAIRILTVAAYVLCVSLAAIMLSLYYVFLWDPTIKPTIHSRVSNCDKNVIAENFAIKLANSSEISPETFFKILLKRYQTQQEQNGEDGRMIEVKEMLELPSAINSKPMIAIKEYLANKNTKIQNDASNKDEDAEDSEADSDTDDYEDESSGQNEISYTLNSNDTTIVFDQDDETNTKRYK